MVTRRAIRVVMSVLLVSGLASDARLHVSARTAEVIDCVVDPHGYWKTHGPDWPIRSHGVGRSAIRRPHLFTGPVAVPAEWSDERRRQPHPGHAVDRRQVERGEDRRRTTDRGDVGAGRCVDGGVSSSPAVRNRQQHAGRGPDGRDRSDSRAIQHRSDSGQLRSVQQRSGRQRRQRPDGGSRGAGEPRWQRVERRRRRSSDLRLGAWCRCRPAARRRS